MKNFGIKNFGDLALLIGGLIILSMTILGAFGPEGPIDFGKSLLWNQALNILIGLVACSLITLFFFVDSRKRERLEKETRAIVAETAEIEKRILESAEEEKRQEEKRNRSIAYLMRA